MSLEERIESLERSRRRWKIVTVLILMVVICRLYVGAQQEKVTKIDQLDANSIVTKSIFVNDEPTGAAIVLEAHPKYAKMTIGSSSRYSAQVQCYAAESGDPERGQPPTAWLSVDACNAALRGRGGAVISAGDKGPQIAVTRTEGDKSDVLFRAVEGPKP